MIRYINPISIFDLQRTVNAVNYIFEQAEKEIPMVDTSVIIETMEDVEIEE